MYAIVLAGGKGERLRPFTEDRPKPMVEIMGIPMLGYQLQWLQGQGVTDVIISCGYRHEVIEAYFGDGERLGMRVRHPQFGVGTVLSVEALDDDTKLVVRFVAVGQKTLRAKYARLEPA